jgi:hypothetical protein
MPLISNKNINFFIYCCKCGRYIQIIYQWGDKGSPNTRRFYRPLPGEKAGAGRSLGNSWIFKKAPVFKLRTGTLHQVRHF